MKTTLIVRNRFICLIDILLTFIGFAIMTAFVFPLSSVKFLLWSGIELISMTAIFYFIVFFFLHIYDTDWIRAGYSDYLRLIVACLVSAIISSVIGQILARDVFWLKFNISANIAVSVLVCALRFAIRILYKAIIDYLCGRGKRVLIVGAGNLANVILHEILQNTNLNYNVVGLIDDDSSKINARIYGTKVLGTRDDIARICEEENIEEIIFAISTIDPKDKLEILDACSKTGKAVKILPGLEFTLNGENSFEKLRKIEIEDLLERDVVSLDNQLIEENIMGKTILVTGGGGSIGSELCRQIIKYNPQKLIILDIYENTTYELQNELEKKYFSGNIEVLIASIRDKERLERIFKKYKPDIVFHAAAHKHVPLMEDSPEEAIKNNVFGTYNTACCAIENGVKRFVMISTDKAVNPTNVMGASKRLCEMIIQTLQKYGKTEFVAVRFGNVLGSHGSVVPRFTSQIEAGGPVTVTHPEITRFFMTIPEAAQLVIQAEAYARGGEIFVLDMGKPVKIYDLAKKMIRLSGYKPDEDIKIEFSGLRPGEKLYEELFMGEESLQKTPHSKIFAAKPIDITLEELDEKLNKLQEALNNASSDIKAVISEIVPTYKYQENKENKEKEMIHS